jgi:type IV secretory pathway VirB10-like protein
MRDLKTQILLPVLLCAAALASFACGRGQEQSGKEAQTSQATVPAPVATPQPQVNELRPVPQSVQIQPETPPPVPPITEPHPQLDSREKALAQRESKLAARERRLREREQQARAAESQPAPEPAPQETGEAAVPAPEPAPQEAAPEPAPVVPEPPVEAPRTVEVSVPAGRVVSVQLKQRLASDTSKTGDIFRVQVARDVRVDGVVAIPRGSEIVGIVTDAAPLPRIGGQARLTLKLTDLVLPSGTTVPIHASLVQEGPNQTGRDAATIGGGAVGGAILGNLLGKGGGKGSVVGAIVGAIAGAAVASRTGKEEVVIPEGTVLGVKLDDDLAVQARARPDDARPRSD